MLKISHLKTIFFFNSIQDGEGGGAKRPPLQVFPLELLQT